MAQNIRIANAEYSNVPALNVPTTSNGTARFTDTSGTTATASDVANGKVFYDASGTETTGTASGGGGSSTKYGMSMDDFFDDVESNGTMSLPSGGNRDLVINGFSKIGTYAMYYKFYRYYSLRSVNFSSLVNADNSYSLYACFSSCSQLTSISFPLLESVDGSSTMTNMCSSCTALTTASFPLLETVAGNSALQGAFNSCRNLTSVDFSSLKTIGKNSKSTTYRQFYTAFNGCNALTSVTFPALETIYCNGTAASYGTFYSNQKVEKYYFPKLSYIGVAGGYTNTTGLLNVFANSGAITEIHFAAANESAIKACTGYDTLWGASGTATAYFDL